MIKFYRNIIVSMKLVQSRQIHKCQIDETAPPPWCDKKRKIQNKNILVSNTLKTKQTEIMYNIG